MTARPTAESLSIFLPDFDSMSAADGLAYVERTRRQLARFDCLPGGAERTLDPAESAAIARLCDELETSIRSYYHPAS